jgi:hypothetical protein
MQEKTKKPRRVYGYKILARYTDTLSSTWACSELRVNYKPKAEVKCHPESEKHGYGLFFYVKLEDAKKACRTQNYDIWKVSMLAEDIMKLPEKVLISASTFSEYERRVAYRKTDAGERKSYRMTKKLRMVKQVG